VEFVVSNAVDPARPPLTPELVAQIFEGCKKSQPTRRMTALSEGIGLEHSLMAARIGGITISLGQEGDIVIFRAVLEAVRGPINPSEGTDSSPFLVTSSSPPNLSHVRPRDPGSLSTTDFPPGLRFYVLDDTTSSRWFVEHSVRTACPTAVITVLGATESDAEQFVALAPENADIVIVDQHLEYGETHLGTTVVRRLRLLGYRGLVCIRSADDSPEDRERYKAAGAHCVMGKDVPGPQMMGILNDAFWVLRNKDPRPTVDSLADIF